MSTQECNEIYYWLVHTYQYLANRALSNAVIYVNGRLTDEAKAELELEYTFEKQVARYKTLGGTKKYWLQEVS